MADVERRHAEFLEPGRGVVSQVGQVKVRHAGG
jgi:hypothetical protein